MLKMRLELVPPLRNGQGHRLQAWENGRKFRSAWHWHMYWFGTPIQFGNTFQSQSQGLFPLALKTKVATVRYMRIMQGMWLKLAYLNLKKTQDGKDDNHYPYSSRNFLSLKRQRLQIGLTRYLKIRRFSLLYFYEFLRVNILPVVR